MIANLVTLFISVLHRGNAHLACKPIRESGAVGLANLRDEAVEQGVMGFTLNSSHKSQFGFIHEGSPVKLIDMQIASLRAQFNAAGWPLTPAGARS